MPGQHLRESILFFAKVRGMVGNENLTSLKSLRREERAATYEALGLHRHGLAEGDLTTATVLAKPLVEILALQRPLAVQIMRRFVRAKELGDKQSPLLARNCVTYCTGGCG